MAVLAYVLPPLTGLVALLYGRDVRTRLHGVRALALGVLLPGALYTASLGPPAAVRAAAFLGALTWLGWSAGAAFGRDPWLPGRVRLRRMLDGSQGR